MYRQGDRVMLLSTSDETTRLRAGDRGIVSSVDGMGTVHVNWDSGSRLGMVPGEDEIMLIEEGPMTPYIEL